MTPEERAELDRLLDIAEKEELLAAEPTLAREHEVQEALAERLETVAVLEREHEHVRQVRQALAPAAEWIDE